MQRRAARKSTRIRSSCTTPTGVFSQSIVEYCDDPSLVEPDIVDRRRRSSKSENAERTSVVSSLEDQENNGYLLRSVRVEGCREECERCDKEDASTKFYLSRRVIYDY